MVERLDEDVPADDVGVYTNASLGLEGIEVELQDFKDTKFPDPGTVAEGEYE